MLTGSVVGDGNFEALQDLFAASRTLTFEGTLTQDGSPPIDVQYTFCRPTQPLPAAVSAGMPAVSNARASLGWSTELLECTEASCSMAAFDLHDERMVASFDVGAGGLLRVLMLSPERPELGRIVCLLDPRRSPPTLEGGDEEAFLSGAEPCIQTALRPTALPPEWANEMRQADSAPTSEFVRCFNPAAAPPPPAEVETVSVTCPVGSQAGDPIQIEHEGQSFDVTVPDGVVAGQSFHVEIPSTPPRAASASPAPAPPPPAPEAPAPEEPAAPPSRREEPSLATFAGHMHHPMFGNLDASLSLVACLGPAEPPQAAPCRAAAMRGRWPPLPPPDPPADDGAPPLPPPTTSWWRGRWRVPEFSVEDECFLGVHGSAGARTAALVMVVPSRTGPKCDLAVYACDGARIQGGDEGWTAARRPEFTLTQRAGGVRVFE